MTARKLGFEPLDTKSNVQFQRYAARLMALWALRAELDPFMEPEAPQALGLFKNADGFSVVQRICGLENPEFSVVLFPVFPKNVKAPDFRERDALTQLRTSEDRCKEADLSVVPDDVAIFACGTACLSDFLQTVDPDLKNRHNQHVNQSIRAAKILALMPIPLSKLFPKIPC